MLLLLSLEPAPSHLPAQALGAADTGNRAGACSFQPGHARVASGRLLLLALEQVETASPPSLWDSKAGGPICKGQNI